MYRALIRLRSILILIVLIIVVVQVSFADSFSYSSVISTDGSFSSSTGSSLSSQGNSLNIQSSTLTSSSSTSSNSKPKQTLNTAIPTSDTFTVSSDSVTNRQGDLDSEELIQYKVDFPKSSKIQVKVTDGGPVYLYAKKGGETPTVQNYNQDYTQRYQITKEKPAKMAVKPGTWFYTIYGKEPAGYEIAAKGD